jgi:hypothetical protein
MKTLIRTIYVLHSAPFVQRQATGFMAGPRDCSLLHSVHTGSCPIGNTLYSSRGMKLTTPFGTEVKKGGAITPLPDDLITK